MSLDQVTREVFWNITLAWLFYVLSALAIAGCAAGLYRRVSIWLRGWQVQQPGHGGGALWRTLVQAGLNRKLLAKDLVAGLTHLCIMWGFIVLVLGTLLLTVHHDVVPFLFGARYLVFSLVLDVAGLAMILGVLLALIRRYVLRARPMHNLLDDALVLVLLLVVGVSGFALEGLRLGALKPPDAAWSPIGALFAAALDGTLSGPWHWHGPVWWFHATASLGLLVYVPISKLFHMFAAPANIYLSEEPPVLTLEEREKLGGDFSLAQLVSVDACVRCNRCENACPSFAAGEPLSPRDVVLRVKGFAQDKHGLRASFGPAAKQRAAARQMVDAIPDGEAWWCTTCKSCVEQCPNSISPMDLIRETRQAMMGEGRSVPPSTRDMLRTLSKHGSPWESGGSKRAAWRKELGCKDLSQGDMAEICYWISCVGSADDRNQEVSRAFVTVLKSAGVDFAHLGKEETCCGEVARGLGEMGLFEALVEGNYGVFADFGVSRIVTTSPHCYHTMKNDYPRVAARLGLEGVPRIAPRHHTEVIHDLITSGKLSLSRSVRKRVTFHDPCYAGRHNGLYEEPRQILRAIAGIELVEMARSRENSFCCGGGGGRMWLESTADQRMAEIRVREATRLEPDILVTACPFCMSNLYDALKTTGQAETMEVRDIAEVVAQAIVLDTATAEVAI